MIIVKIQYGLSIDCTIAQAGIYNPNPADRSNTATNSNATGTGDRDPVTGRKFLL